MGYPTSGSRSKLRVYTLRYFVNLHQPACKPRSRGAVPARTLQGRAKLREQSSLAMAFVKRVLPSTKHGEGNRARCAGGSPLPVFEEGPGVGCLGQPGAQHAAPLQMMAGNAATRCTLANLLSPAPQAAQGGEKYGAWRVERV